MFGIAIGQLKIFLSISLNLIVTVLDDEDKSITAGSIVTVTVTLKRRNMIDDFDIDKLTGESGEIIEDDEENEDKIKEEVDENEECKVRCVLFNLITNKSFNNTLQVYIKFQLYSVKF